MKNKPQYLLILFWLLGLSIGPIAVLKNPLFLGFESTLSYLSFIQRAGGLTLLIALSLQLFLQACGWLKKYHHLQGVVTALLIILHPMTLFISNILGRKIFDPFYVFTDFCLLCETKPELFYTLGRLAFWFGAIAFLAVLMRKHQDWKNNWRYVHGFFYLVFFMAAVHAWFIGSDVKSAFFMPFFLVSLLLVLVSVIIKIVVSKRKIKVK